jgi:hypothetical protein
LCCSVHYRLSGILPSCQLTSWFGSIQLLKPSDGRDSGCEVYPWLPIVIEESAPIGPGDVASRILQVDDVRHLH